MRKIIIDTDAGVDDTLAIIYATQSAMNQIEFISTVSGNVHVESVTKNVSLIRNLIGASFPVYKGSSKPLQGKLITAPEVHGPDGIGGYRSTNGDSTYNAKSGNAPLKIAEAAARYGRSLSIVSLGPMTNIARAVKIDRDAMLSIKEVVQMGGVFYGYGNTTTFTEFNIFVDPSAAQFVLESGIRVKFVPLDLTEKIYLPRSAFIHMVRSSSKLSIDLKRLITRAVNFYMKYHIQTESLDGCFLHDPIATAAALHPDWFTWTRSKVAIESHGELTRGMTISDFRKKDGGDSNALVATNFSYKLFLKDFLLKTFGLETSSGNYKAFLHKRFVPDFIN